MKFVSKRHPLPRRFCVPGKRSEGIIAEHDVTVHPRGRLAAKVLVFESTKSLSRFWKRTNHDPLGRNCRGAVNALGYEVIETRGKSEFRFLEGDPRYFCIVGLVKGWLSCEVIAHEAVHAGYCYEKRVKRNLFGDAAADFDEERIAYPTGRIADGINNFLHNKRLYLHK